MSKDTKPVVKTQPSAQTTPAPGELQDSELDKVSGGILGVAPTPGRVTAAKPAKAGDNPTTPSAGVTTSAYDINRNTGV